MSELERAAATKGGGVPPRRSTREKNLGQPILPNVVYLRGNLEKHQLSLASNILETEPEA